MSRYDGKPFLRLLDCYVLKSIGELDAQQESSLKAMEPKLADIYGQGGSWFDIVANQMDFPPTLPSQIKSIWDAGKANAALQGVTVSPEEFTQQFVDKNFPT
ncbi:hypothetical protein [Sphingomonas sp. DT-204]|uniref:hypothetical protein n=1 Tax=Sphingomonas sp. DT-204 TaxID=3396166 RepID=UPI003F1E1D27